jgi:hypothetical protein
VLETYEPHSISLCKVRIHRLCWICELESQQRLRRQCTTDHTEAQDLMPSNKHRTPAYRHLSISKLVLFLCDLACAVSMSLSGD